MRTTRSHPRSRRSLTSHALLAALSLASLCAIVATASAQVPCPSLQANGTVRAVEVVGDLVYLGGEFTQLGRPTGGMVFADSADGHALAIPQVLGTVRAIVADGAGGWFIAGTFTHVGGEPRRNVARIAADGSLMAWDPGGADSTVYALAVRGGTLYLGGQFHHVGGQSRICAAAVDIATAAVTTWDPQATNDVNALAVQGDVVYLGGIFFSLGGVPRAWLGAVDATTGALTAWDPQPDKQDTCIVANGGTIYVGGLFTRFSGNSQEVARNRIAALDAATGTVRNWDPNANSTVRAMTLAGGRLWVTGVFTSIGGAARGRAAALDTTTGAATAWNPRVPTGLVQCIAVSGGTVYLGGTFSALDGGKPRARVAALDTSVGTASAWTFASDATAVSALVANGDRVLIGGDLTAIELVARNHLAALDAATGSLTAWDPNVDGPVYALASTGSKVYAGGAFSLVGPTSCTGLAEIDTTSGVATDWPISTTVLDGEILALEPVGSTLYVGGGFSRRLIGFELSNHTLTTWNPVLDGRVRALAYEGGRLYAGGDFATVGGQIRRGLAAIDRTTGAATPFDPNPDGTSVQAIAIRDGLIHVAGPFSTIGGAARIGLAAVDASGLATSWNPGPAENVTTLAIGTDAVYAGGSYLQIGGVSRRGLAALDRVTGAALPWDAGMVGTPIIQSLALTGDRLIVGGAFTDIAGLPRQDVGCVPAVATVSVEGPATAPGRGGLRSVRPNPSHGATRIEFALARRERVRLHVVDVGGRVRALLLDGVREAGVHTFDWAPDPAAALRPGIYFVVLDAGTQRSILRLAALR